MKLDKSANLAKDILISHTIDLESIVVVPDEIDRIQAIIEAQVEKKISLIITIGGTGISSRDITIEAVSPFIEKELPGFGELFRNLTYNSVGTVSIMTRTVAGVKKQSCIVCLPGSPNAVELGINLILKEILHIINLRK